MKNTNRGKKLLMVGISFLALGMGIFALNNRDTLFTNNELNAATNVTHATDPNTRPINFEALQLSHLTNPSGSGVNPPMEGLKTIKGDTPNRFVNIGETFALGEWNGLPLEWKLIWDYGDGTGVAMVKDSLKKANGEYEKVAYNSKCFERYACPPKERFYNGEYFAFLYGDNAENNMTTTGGTTQGFTNIWWNTVKNTSNNISNNIARYNQNPIPQTISKDPLTHQGMNFEFYAYQGVYNQTSGNPGRNDFTDQTLLPIESDFTTSSNADNPGTYAVYPSLPDKDGLGSPEVTDGQLTSAYKASIAPMIYINLVPIDVSLRYKSKYADFQEGKSETKSNTKIGEIVARWTDTGPYNFYEISSGTTTSTDIDQNGNLIGAGVLLSDNFALENINDANGAADLHIGSKPLKQGTHYVKVSATDTYQEDSVIIRIDVKEADISGLFTPSQAASYTYGELAQTNILGSLSATDSSGDVTSLTDFDFVYVNNSTDPTSEDGALSTSGTGVTVKDANKLDVGTHTYTMRATKNGKFSDFTFDIVVDKMDLTISTLIGGTAYPSTAKSIVLNSTGYGASSFSTTPALPLPYSEVLETGVAPATYLYKNTSTSATTTTPETTVGSYELEASFPGATADLTNNYNVTYSNSKLNVIPETLTSYSFTPSKTPFTYGDIETLAGGTIGSFAGVTSAGSTLSYKFCESATTCIAPTSSKDNMSISGTDVTVDVGKKLNEGSYTYKIQVSTVSGINEVKDMSFTINKKPVNAKTKIKTFDSLTIDVNDPLPANTDFSFVDNNGFIVGDNISATYEFKDSNGAVSTAPNTKVGTYNLVATYSDEVNYAITKSEATLVVQGNAITDITSDLKTAYTYGDTETISGGTNKLGTLAITTTSGNDITNPIFTLCESDGTNPATSKDGFSISGSDLVVANGKLNAGTYDVYVMAKSKIQGMVSAVKKLEVKVDKKAVSTQSKFDTSTSHVIEVNDPLPDASKFKFSDAGGFLTSDAITATYSYKDSSNKPTTTPNLTAGVYKLVATFSDETNYDITKNEATLTVKVNDITSIITTHKASYTYGDAETIASNGATLSAFTITTTSGKDEANPTFALCDDAAGTNPSTSKNQFSITGNILKVASGKLNAGSYDLFVKATSALQNKELVKKITIKVDPIKISTQTKIKTQLNHDIEVKDPLPLPTDLSFSVTSGAFLSGENITASYKYVDSKGIESLTPNKQAGVYTLVTTFSDETNYVYTKKAATLTVTGNSITELKYTGQTTPYIYGHADTTSGGSNKLGTLSIETVSGSDESNPIFELCDDAAGTAPATSKGAFAISGNDIIVTSIRLDVGSYNLFVKATSKVQGMESSIKQITVTINQKDLHVTINSPASITKKAGTLLSAINVTGADYTVATLESGDTLKGTPAFIYTNGFSDASVGSVGIQVSGLSDNNPKNNYNIIYDVANITVTQDSILPADYKITGTLGNNGWYTSDVSITILKSGFDEFISKAPVSSLGNSIVKDTNGEHKDIYLQLRNSTSKEITTSALETIKIDKQDPDFTLTATVNGSAYVDDTPTTSTITVALTQATANASKVTYYYTTDANDATTNPLGDPAKWTSLGNGVSTINFSDPQRLTYYFKAVSGSGKVTATPESVKIYNNAQLPNPVDLGWVDNTTFNMSYGDIKSLKIKGNAKNYPVTYTFLDASSDPVDVSTCLEVNTSGDNIEAISGTCSTSQITIKAQVGSYATPLTKVITVKKVPLHIEALYEDASNAFVSTVNILTNDPEPTKKVQLSTGSMLVGAEKTGTISDLGTFTYTYLKSGETNSTSSISTSIVGSYKLTPLFNVATSGILDKYNITWRSATLNINDSNINAVDLYDIIGTKGRNDWYTEVPVTIHPKHNTFNMMSVDGSAPATTDYSFGLEGDNSAVTLEFSDGKGHTNTKTEQIKIDTTIPEFSVEASSNGNPYTSGSDTQEDVSVTAMNASTTNPSNVQYYYTTNKSISTNSPSKVDGTPNSGWVEITGAFDLSTKSKLYIKAVSGAGLVSDIVEFEANINKLDYTKLPTVSVMSGGVVYPADGSWAKDDVIFTLSNSTSGYEVCVSSDTTCTTWMDMSDPTTSEHKVIGNIQNQYYYFRIKNANNAFDATTGYKVSLDKVKPDTPSIVVSKKNTGALAKLMNTLSFGQWFNEELEVSMSSDDDFSGVKEILYDVKAADGTLMAGNQVYSSALSYTDASYKLSAKAKDHAGNISTTSDETEVLVDMVKPVVSGIKDKEVYLLPYAFVHYSDSASGIDSVLTTQNNGASTSPLANDTLFTGKGNVGVSVADNAGNQSDINFRIDGLPDISEWLCNEDHSATVEAVKKQYEELKTVLATNKKKLSDAQALEIETWLKEATGTCKITEPENNVTVESDTDKIPENTVLVVDVVTTTLAPEDVEVAEDEEIKAAYDVYFKQGGTIFKQLNDSILTVRLPMGAFKGAQGLRLVEVNEDGSIAEVVFVVEENEAVFKTNILKKYAFIAKKSSVNTDTDKDGKPDINVDIDGDGTPDINIDVDDDGIPDIDIDTDGDGLPDYNVDSDDDGKSDVNVGPIENPWKPTLCVTIKDVAYCTSTVKKPYLNIDTDKDGRPDVNVDLDKDDIPDINIDVNEDFIPDIDIDSDGDGIGDLNVDTNGDGKADKNLTNISSWTPDKDVDGSIKYDTMSTLTKILEPEPKPDEDGTIPTTPDSGGSVLGSYSNNSSNGTGGAGTGDTSGMLVSWLVVICSCTFSFLMFLVKRFRKNQ